MRLRYCFLIAAAAGTAHAAPPDAVALAARIDGHLAAGWQKAGVEPADPADDAAFARRAYLDLVGRVPTVAEARGFIGDRSADKRAKLVERLIGSAAHARHLATHWRRSWVPQTDTQQFARLADGFETWLAFRLRDNVGYDRITRELLTVATAGSKATPRTFFEASEDKPENLAANTARAFLGVNLDCAQCHDHPFARWTREQFWQTAAFFAPARDGRLELSVPNSKKVLGPVLLDGRDPAMPKERTTEIGRAALADWVADKRNPYFAKNAVNRLWANYFGTGLVEPLDDLSGENPPSHPELLDELAKVFAESGFDLRYLTRAMLLTRAYQLAAGGTPTDPRLFARMPVRGLTGEQLYDSLRVAAGLPVERDDVGQGVGRDPRRSFAAQLRIERPAHAERSIVQALALMNGRLTFDLTDAANNPTLAALDAPFLDTRGKVETLFLATLGRLPGDEERSLFVPYVEQGGADKDRRKALADVFWSLLNSSEFNTNH